MLERNDLSGAFDRYLTPDEERKLFRVVGQYRDALARRDYAWMQLLRQTGIRVNALAGLTVGDARRAQQEGYLELRAVHAKGGRGGKVFLTKRAKEAVRELLRVREKQGFYGEPDHPLIMSRIHRGISVRSLQARLALWCERARIRAASPHWFRHTLAKRVMKQSTAKDPRGIVKRVLGHVSITSTAIYTEPDREDVELAMEEAS